jgi:hypothetical protein
MSSRSRRNRKVAIMEASIEEDIKKVQEEDLYEEEDMVMVETYLLYSLTMEKWAKCHNFVPNYTHSVSIAIE